MGNGNSSLLLVLVLFALLLLASSRSRRRVQRQRDEIQARLAPGAEVVTGSGLYGTVVEVLEDGTVMLETSPGQVTRWDRLAVSRVVTAAEPGDDRARRRTARVEHGAEPGVEPGTEHVTDGEQPRRTDGSDGHRPTRPRPDRSRSGGRRARPLERRDSYPWHDPLDPAPFARCWCWWGSSPCSTG